jgi:Leucine-rich repeat (LRR) protein
MIFADIFMIIAAFLVLFRFFSSCRSFVSSADLTLPTDQYNALYEFYNSTNGTYWSWQTTGTSIPWDFDGSNPNPCGDPNWQGVTCSCEVSGCTLSELYLVAYNLSGRLPESIGAWVDLENLDLSLNHLTGRIPTNISSWKSLTIFSLEKNSMTGPLNAEIGNLTKLFLADFSNNQFSSIANEVFNPPLISEFYGNINRIKGTLPDTIGNLKHCIYFTIESNLFTGPIPSSIGNMVALLDLYLLDNQFSGSVPDSIGNLIALQGLYLEYNRLNGSIPASIEGLSNLQYIDLSYNLFSGSIPPSFYNLINLLEIQFSNTLISGTLSEDFGKMSIVEYIDMGYNNIFGSLPSSISEMHKLDIITFSGNLFSQSIPSSWKNLKLLGELFLTENSLTGVLPFFASDSLTTVLAVMFVAHNFLNGSVVLNAAINSELLFIIGLEYNQFSGSIPLMSPWDSLIQYEVESNYLSGSLPEGLSLYLMDVFLAGDNYMTGSFPLSFLNTTLCNNLFNFNLSNNLLSGSIPEIPRDAYKLEQFVFNNNFFTSSVPESISSLQKLVYISLNDNDLTGRIPSNLFLLTQLKQLFLQYNSLTGNINTVLNTALPGSLSNLDLSNNQLTGSLSASLFWGNKTTNLISFAVVANCLKGSIPTSICGVNSLSALALDGLSTSSDCRDYFFTDSLSSSFTAFSLYNAITGSIPECLFSMPNLTTLHLSGNGFTGSLSSTLSISSSLTDLSLSYNSLTGTIPSNFQEKLWINLDLSYNKFVGTLTESFASIPSTGSLYLDVNRLSDEIPSQILKVQTLSILDGNIFSCSSASLEEENNELPSNDPSSNRYSCGSNTVNDLLYFWIALLFILGLVGVFAFYYSLKNNEGNENQAPNTAPPTKYQTNGFSFYFSLCLLWRNGFISYCENHPVSHLKELQLLLIKTRRLFGLVALLSVIVLMPVYGVTSIFFKSYTNKYAWTISGILLTGESAAIILFFCFVSLISIICYFLRTLVINEVVSDERSRHNSNNSEIPSLKSNVENEEPLWRDWLASYFSCSVLLQKLRPTKSTVITTFGYLTIFFFDLMALGAADIGYVIVILNYNSMIILLAGIALTLFRLLLNNLLCVAAIPFILKKIELCLECCQRSSEPGNSETDVKSGNSSTAEPNENNRVDNSGVRQLRTSKDSNSSSRRISKFNRFFSSSDYVFSHSDISFLMKLTLFNIIVLPIIAVLIILPDCFQNVFFAASEVDSQYTYKDCVFYTLTDEYACVTSYQSTSYSPPFIYSYQCSSKVVINYIPIYLLTFIFTGILFPLKNIILKILYDRIRSTTSEQEEHIDGGIDPEENVSDAKNKVQQKQSFALTLVKTFLPTNLQELPDYTNPNDVIDRKITLFNKIKFLTILSSSLVIMIVFGILFPPLALVGAISLILLSFYEEMVIGRILTEARKLKGSSSSLYYERKLEEDCSGMNSSLKLALFPIIIVSCFFLAYILLDTWGDKDGWQAALPISILMATMPLIIFLIYQVFLFVINARGFHEERIRSRKISLKPLSFDQTSSVRNSEKHIIRTRTVEDGEAEDRKSSVRRSSLSIVQNPMLEKDY